MNIVLLLSPSLSPAEKKVRSTMVRASRSRSRHLRHGHGKVNSVTPWLSA